MREQSIEIGDGTVMDGAAVDNHHRPCSPPLITAWMWLRLRAAWVVWSGLSPCTSPHHLHGSSMPCIFWSSQSGAMLSCGCFAARASRRRSNHTEHAED